MSRLVWDAVGERLYHTGVRMGTLFTYNADTKAYNTGVAWNGITGITESPSGAEATPLYADDIKYLNMRSAEDFGATINAYMYPDEWNECDGSSEIAPGVYAGQQIRKTFGLAWRSTIGNDTLGDAYGYELHIVYGGTAAPSEKTNSTVNDSNEAADMSWEISTTPVNVPGFKPTAHIRIDSTKTDAAKLALIEDMLFGCDTNDATLPDPAEIIAIMTAATPSVPVTNFLSGVSGSNTNRTTLKAGTYTQTLTAAAGKTIVNVVVLVNGEDVTSTAYTSATRKITVTNPAGPIVIFATAN